MQVSNTVGPNDCFQLHVSGGAKTQMRPGQESSLTQQEQKNHFVATVKNVLYLCFATAKHHSTNITAHLFTVNQL